jgi:hypothetical protein
LYQKKKKLKESQLHKEQCLQEMQLLKNLNNNQNLDLDLKNQKLVSPKKIKKLKNLKIKGH